MKNILEQVGRNDGMTVPEGYFDEFAARMEANLPTMEWESARPEVMPRSFWQKVRPYVYMAAMFLGVWCMMSLFNFISSSSGLGVENSAVFAKAIQNDHFVSDYLLSDGEVDQYDIMEDLYYSGYTPSELFASDNDSYTTDI